MVFCIITIDVRLTSIVIIRGLLLIFPVILYVMKKILDGKELSLFIKQQQAREVRSLKQSKAINPHFAIIRTNPNPVTDMYVRLKIKYGNDIGVVTEVIDIPEADINQAIKDCNINDAIHGIIVQLPLANPENTSSILNTINPKKDVDGLGEKAVYDAATTTAINWLLAGYNIELNGKGIVIVGKGRLVGEPLSRIWAESGYNVSVVEKDTENKEEIIREADVIVSATGSPGVITSEMIKPDAIVIDAGVATDSNGMVGDVSAEVRLRDDIAITPEKGGVGPLTVSALFHNVLVAARKTLQ